jgi:sugar/nucleoside kinase (ribokinase family)
MTSHDVYSYGVISSSTLYKISGPFPAPEGYAEIDDCRDMVGGEATNSSIVLSRLGARVTLDGNWLGADEHGSRTKALLTDCGIDTTRLPLQEGFASVREVVFAAQETRTIFGTYAHLLEGKNWNTPQESDIVRSKVVSLDPFFAQPALRAAQIASKAGIPVVTVDCKYDDALLRLSSAVVIAESFVRENYPDRDPQEVFARYGDATSGLVIFTFGAASCWYGRRGEPTRQLKSYAIEAVDTTGAGDSFRAGIVYGFLRGWNDDKMIDFAAAVAAIVCTRFPGVMQAPGLDEVYDFLHANGRDVTCP